LTGNQRRSFTLTGRNRALFDAVLARSGITPRSEAIGRRPAVETAPCSFAQRRLWFLDRLTPGGAFYNIPSALRLAYPLDPACLERSLAALVRRHESLRTTFRAVEGEPVQVIATRLEIPVTVTDLRGLPPEAREADALRIATEEACRPFDLERGPLLRVGLLQLNEFEQVLLATMHHIVADGWSVDVFFRELTALYAAFASGRDAALPELPVQYGDFAAWQRERLQGEELERQAAWWKTQLAGLPALELPADHPRPPLASYRGGRAFLNFDAATSSALRELSRSTNATLFMTLLAGFAVLLSRYSGQEDFAVGALTAGRNRPETEGLIGLFVNTVVLRVDLRGDPTFREGLARVRETALEAYAHAELPFEKLVEELHPERDLSRNPLVQVTFQLFHAAARDEKPVERQLDADRGVATFDLALDMWEDSDGLRGRLEYSSELFDAGTAADMLRHFEALVRAIATNPDARIAFLPLLSEAERNEQIIEWNRTARAFPHLRVHEIFEAQAARTPHAPALSARGETLTYSELNRRADLIASGLRDRGAGPGTVVAIEIERSIEAIAAFLGVLKAGAAYLPIDPAWPRERRDFMLADAGARIMWGAGQPAAEPATHPRELAYILYTSGSTGRPKGVMVDQGSLANHAFACVERYGLTPADRVLQFASLAFDVAAEELFPTWAAGACVVLSPGLMPSPEDLAAVADVTVLNLPTPYFDEWVDALEAGCPTPPCLRLVVIGSDRADERRVARWLDLAGDRIRLIHAYGATEATITSLAFDVTGEAWRPSEPLPVGRPLANVSAYILDRHLQPMPVGVAGDLYLGGAGIARGYVNHSPDAFVPSPFGEGRLYRTGDRAQYRADGNILFLGRADQQMKIRGYRVEPAEIETALKECAGVRNAAVALDDSGRLVAYVAGSVPLADPLAALKARLPDYMLPAAIVQLDALPRNAAGKLDRSRLPQPAPARASAQPASEMERVVAGIWREALELAAIDIDASFFELGGHSLLLLRVHSRLEIAVGRALSVVDLFRHPTIRTLARFLSRSGQTQTQP
jgi:amino acid adenylation domain-containing protein